MLNSSLANFPPRAKFDLNKDKKEVFYESCKNDKHRGRFHSPCLGSSNRPVCILRKKEITQDVYQAVTGQNPSKEKGDKFPVESVSWYDAIVFCNKLSAIQQKTPCYSVNGSANPDEWGYAPHQNQKIAGKIDFDPSADGYRIPTLDEWDVAIRGGEKFKYSGSDDLDSVAWTDCNSGGKLHQVAQLKPNAFGIYERAKRRKPLLLRRKFL